MCHCLYYEHLLNKKMAAGMYKQFSSCCLPAVWQVSKNINKGTTGILLK